MTSNNGSSLKYDSDRNIAKNTNVGYVYQYQCQCQPLCQYPCKYQYQNQNQSQGSDHNKYKLFLIAIKDIKAGEELSRHYGGSSAYSKIHIILGIEDIYQLKIICI
jgi:SET domain-containing protein